MYDKEQTVAGSLLQAKAQGTLPVCNVSEVFLYRDMWTRQDNLVLNFSSITFAIGLGPFNGSINFILSGMIN